jgi:outer membrane protein assembly factor BamB
MAANFESFNIAPKVFISYAKEDYHFASGLYLELKKKGLDPWMDKPPDPYHLNGLLPGHSWKTHIPKKIYSADYAILVLSPSSIRKKGFVQKEYRLALEAASHRTTEALFVIPILTEPCELPTIIVDTVRLDDFQWIDYSKEGIDPIVRAIDDDFSSKAVVKKTDYAILSNPSESRRSEPRIKWSTHIGAMHWRNNIVIDGEEIFASSSGEEWNAADDEDGVYCLNKDTGMVKWFFKCEGDANEITSFGRQLAFGTDRGYFYIVSKKGKRKIFEKAFDSEIFAAPLVIDNRLFVTCYDGTCLLIDLQSNQVLCSEKIPLKVRANPVTIKINEDRRIAVLGETGELCLVSASADGIRYDVVFRKKYFESILDKSLLKAEFVAEPLVRDKCVIAGYARGTYYDCLPVICFDMEKRAVVWEDRRHAKTPISCGNLRAKFGVIDDMLIAAPAYSDGVWAINQITGEVLWQLGLGQDLFQQWSAPTSIGGGRAIIGRADGLLYQIDARKGRVDWSLPLTVSEDERGKRGTEKKLYPGDPISNGITASPAWDGQHIYIGTTEGALFCIENT